MDHISNGVLEIASGLGSVSIHGADASGNTIMSISGVL